MKWLVQVLTGAPRLGAFTLESADLLLRPAMIEDFAQWAALRAQSRAFLEPWEPSWPLDDLTEPSFRARLARAADDIASDNAYPFLIFARESGDLLGGISLSHVRRRAAQSAMLGYWMGAPHAGKGHMGRAVRAICGFAFERLRLERIEAACLPGNAASIKVLTKAGFSREGFARQYLAIAGRRQDHLLFGLIRADFAAANQRAPIVQNR